MPDRYWGRQGELCVKCPAGALCNQSTYDPPAALPGFYLNELDIGGGRGEAGGSEKKGENEHENDDSSPLTVREKADKERALEEYTTEENGNIQRRCPAERYLDPVLDKSIMELYPTAGKKF